MFENIIKFFKKFGKNEKEDSKVTAKERLHLVLAQDRANISADFLEMMKQEIIDVIKKYIDIDEEAIDVRMTNKPGEDGTVGAPALYANIPIVTIKNEARKIEGKLEEEKENRKKEEQKVVETVESKDEDSNQTVDKEEINNIEEAELSEEKEETENVEEELEQDIEIKEEIIEKDEQKEEQETEEKKKENVKEVKNEKKDS